MHGDPPAATHPDGHDLPRPALHRRLDPHTRFTGTTIPGYPIIGQQPDRDLFQISQILPDIGIEFLKVQNGIPYQLPRPMIGDISSPVASKEFNAPLLHRLLVNQHMFHLPALAKSINRRMFYQQQIMCRGLFVMVLRMMSGRSGRFRPLPGLGLDPYIFIQQRLLVIPGLLVGHPAQIFEDHYLHNRSSGFCPKITPRTETSNDWPFGQWAPPIFVRIYEIVPL